MEANNTALDDAAVFLSSCLRKTVAAQAFVACLRNLDLASLVPKGLRTGPHRQDLGDNCLHTAVGHCAIT